MTRGEGQRCSCKEVQRPTGAHHASQLPRRAKTARLLPVVRI